MESKIYDVINAKILSLRFLHYNKSYNKSLFRHYLWNF